MSDPKDRRKFENVLREPLTRQRLMLNGKIRAAQDEEKPQPFTLEELQKFIGGIRDNTEEFKQEALNVLEAAATGKAPAGTEIRHARKTTRLGRRACLSLAQPRADENLDEAAR